MELNIELGTSKTKEIIVSEKDTAIFYGSGSLEVYATPGMISLMENTSKDIIEEILPNGYTTVGISVDIKHIKATPLGMKVVCTSILEKTEGKKLFFKVEAEDEKGKIGLGTHVRYIVQKEQFLKNINK